MMSVLKEKLDFRVLIQPPIDYARLAPSAFSTIARQGPPEMFINAIGAGIGDDFLHRHILRTPRRYQHKFWVTSKHPQLYLYNKDIEVVVPPFDRYDIFLERLGVKVVCPWYTRYNPAYDRDDSIPEQHIISFMCQKAGIDQANL